ncbi:MAG: ATP phosphoribosyltransferase [Acidimicrobiales bacterium]
MYVADGLFDIGICGRDWIEETNSNVVSIGEMTYSKVSDQPVRVVVAVPNDSPWNSVSDLPDGIRVSSEYPEVTERYFKEQGVNADIRLSYGATEAKVPDIVDVVVDITETGNALRAAGLKIIDTIVTSYTELVANPDAYADPAKRLAMEQIHTLLQGVLEARGKVLVKLNVPLDRLDAAVELLPSSKAPTVNELFGGSGYAIESVVERAAINILIPELRAIGGTDIIELSISKIVH